MTGVDTPQLRRIVLHMTNTPEPAAPHVMCDDCSQPHPAEYSHEDQFGHGPVYAVVCNGLTDYYLEERVIRPAATPVSGKGRNRNSDQCVNCGESIERTKYPKRDWYHVSTNKRAC